VATEPKKEVYAARTPIEKHGIVWVLFDEASVMYGTPKETRKSLLSRWQQIHGKVNVLVRIKGICRPSELAMTISTLQQSVKESQP
jgi:hypothetical protein